MTSSAGHGGDASSTDTVERHGDALIQHGPLSNRIYLMKLGPSDPDPLIAALDRLAAERGYTKIFAKIPERARSAFLTAGFVEEAFVPALFGGQDGGSFLGKFLSEERRRDGRAAEDEAVLALARSKAAGKTPSLSPGCAITPCLPADAAEMSALYRTVFSSYPFPIFDPVYIRSTMESHMHYVAVREGARIVALGSMELDPDARHVEMTDFATHPDARGAGLSAHLLRAMEPAARTKGALTAITIARALSAGINTTFARAGYRFAGKLVNNTHIGGALESMNVWHKRL